VSRRGSNSVQGIAYFLEARMETPELRVVRCIAATRVAGTAYE